MPSVELVQFIASLCPVRAPGLYKVTKPGYILECFIVLWFIRAPFYVLLVFVGMCSVFWLFWLTVITCQVIGKKDPSEQ